MQYAKTIVIQNLIIPLPKSATCLLFHKIVTDPRAKTLVLISWNKADDIKGEIMFHH